MFKKEADALRKNILHIAGDSKFGGGSIVILDIARSALKNGYEVDILTTDEVFASEATRFGIGVVRRDVIWREIRPLKDILGLARLYMFLRKSRYDIVHTHTSKGGFIGRIAARLARTPRVIHTVHGFAFHEESSRRAIALYSFLERIAAYFCDYIVFVSRFHKDWAEKLHIGSEKQRVVIRNGIDENRLASSRCREDIAREFDIPADIPWIVTVGRIARQKGLPYLLEAAVELKRKGLDFRLLIIGEGPLYSEITGLAQHSGLEDTVVFTGFRHDVGSFVRNADIIALPSLWEGLSISLLEAMAAGKPIVTTDIGSNLEVIEDGVSGIIVPAKNPGVLARKLVLMLADKEMCVRLGANAYEKYKNYFTLDLMLNKYIRLYGCKLTTPVISGL